MSVAIYSEVTFPQERRTISVRRDSVFMCVCITSLDLERKSYINED